jgi:microcystin-dependent protein
VAEPYVAEIMMFAGNFAPLHYATCSGQLLSISQNTALFSLVGTFYGGNGTSNFGLPNLQDRVVNGQGQGPGLQNYFIGQTAGETAVGLLSTNMPIHNHTLNAATAGAVSQRGGVPSSTVWLGDSAPGLAYAPASTPSATFSPFAVGQTGGATTHNNIQPVLAVTFCIALSGVFPARN